MKLVILSTILLACVGCGALPQLLNETEHVLDDTAVELKVSQEALRKDTNVKATIEVTNSKTGT